MGSLRNNLDFSYNVAVEKAMEDYRRRVDRIREASTNSKQVIYLNSQYKKEIAKEFRKPRGGLQLITEAGPRRA